MYRDHLIGIFYRSDCLSFQFIDNWNASIAATVMGSNGTLGAGGGEREREREESGGRRDFRSRDRQRV